MFIILGDVHLGAQKSLSKVSVGQTLNSRVSDQLNILDWTLEQAIENHCSDIILTGDIFEDPKPESYLIKLFIAWIKKCEINNIFVHVIIGNHDILRNGNIYSSALDIITAAEIKNACVYYDITTISIGTSCITLLPFKDKKSFFEASNAKALEKLQESLVYDLAFIPKTYSKILVGHLAIEGSIYTGDEIDDLSNELFCPINMFQGYDYVWMGHVHSPQVLNKSNPYVAHIGSMDISNFSENAHKKHIVIFNTNTNTFTTKNIPTRDLQKIVIDIPKDIEDSTSFVLKEIEKLKYKNSIVKIDISSINSSPVNKLLIEKKLKELGAFTVSAISEKKQQEIIKKEKSTFLDKTLSIPSAINKYAEIFIDKDDKDAYIECSLEILNSLK